MTKENNRGKILIIEDDPDQILIYSRKFREDGFEVVAAMNMVEAMEQVVEQKPDLIVLDIILDGFFSNTHLTPYEKEEAKTGGVKVLKELKRDEKTANIPVLVLTNLDDEGIKETTLRLGAVDFITKATKTPAEVAERVGEILKK